jgi:hypothetical protein
VSSSRTPSASFSIHMNWLTCGTAGISLVECGHYCTRCGAMGRIFLVNVRNIL